MESKNRGCLIVERSGVLVDTLDEACIRFGEMVVKNVEMAAPFLSLLRRFCWSRGAWVEAASGSSASSYRKHSIDRGKEGELR